MTKQPIEKSLQSTIDEILFGSSDKPLSEQINGAEKAVRSQSSPTYIYLNLTEQPEVLVKRN